MAWVEVGGEECDCVCDLRQENLLIVECFLSWPGTDTVMAVLTDRECEENNAISGQIISH